MSERKVTSRDEQNIRRLCLQVKHGGVACDHGSKTKRPG